jgi:hypothetical protein
LSLGLLLQPTACGGSKKKPASVTTTTTKRDAGIKDSGAKQDADFPLPTGPEVDAAGILPGDPPTELAGQSCAVDTNKLYAVATTMREPEPTQLAVDLVGSRFGLAYLDKSPKCIDAVYLAQLQGASGLGMPEISTAIDDCTTVDHVAITHNGDAWLFASVDARMDQRDLWVQAYLPGSTHTAHRLTNSLVLKREIALSALGSDSAIAAWVEDDTAGGSHALNVRLLTSEGDPTAEPVVIEQSTSKTYAGLALAPIGTDFIALGYRRGDNAGHSEMVLQMLAVGTAKPDRDAWVLTTEGGPFGNIDISSDDEGAGVIYSLVQGTSKQLWFQRLDLTGHAAPVMSGARTGGPMAASRVVGPPLNAVDASLAKLPNGFIVAYRAMPGGSVSSPRIRVHFLDRFGRVIAESDVALAQSFGGRAAIEAAYDGRVVVAWSDQAEDGKTTTTAVKLPCVGGI